MLALPGPWPWCVHTQSPSCTVWGQSGQDLESPWAADRPFSNQLCSMHGVKIFLLSWSITVHKRTTIKLGKNKINITITLITDIRRKHGVSSPSMGRVPWPDCHLHHDCDEDNNLVSLYFEPSQIQKVTSWLKTMFNLSPIYSARKSSNHKLSINHRISHEIQWYMFWIALTTTALRVHVLSVGSV